MIQRAIGEYAPLNPRRMFDEPANADLSVGAEEEFTFVYLPGGAPAGVAEDVLETLAGDPRFEHEFRTSQIESVSPVCLAAADVERELQSARRALIAATPPGIAPLAVGCNPVTHELAPITASPRYEQIARVAPWSVPLLETCGLHVHVGVTGADRALAVANALRSYLPLLGAIAANSPFYRGVDTDLASARAHLNRALSRGGVPPVFATWADFSAFLDWGSRTGLVPDASHHWYDSRLNLVTGTVEVRVCDAQTDVAAAGTLIALIHALVAWLAGRFDSGDPLPVLPTHVLAEAARLAERDGAGGVLPDPVDGRLSATAAQAVALAETLSPTASELGTDDLTARVRSLVTVGGAARQRLIAEVHGQTGLVRWLAATTTSQDVAGLVGSVTA